MDRKKEEKQMEPLFFKPIYKNVIWGGNNISKIFKRNVIGNDIGESWELSAHPSRISEIDYSDLDEKNLLELFNNKKIRKEVFGNHCVEMDRFPILIKFIDATKNLSIQVHPGDEYAKTYENDCGKTEVWYIVECKDDAKIIYGFKDTVSSENLKDAINNIEENVNYVTVHKGDFISIPSGTIHAIMDGVVICEVQQSSDVTYRVYDWNRLDKNGTPRELHKQKALDVINLCNDSKIQNYEKIDSNLNIYKSKVFCIDMIENEGQTNEISNEDSFFAYILLEGTGSIKSRNYCRAIEKGTTFLIPAALGNYSLIGNMKLMKIYV